MGRFARMVYKPDSRATARNSQMLPGGPVSLSAALARTRPLVVLLVAVAALRVGHAHSRRPTDAQGLDASGALARLVEGNRRKVSGKHQPRQLDPVKRAQLEESQSPIAVVVACSDSRTPPELLFDQGRGDLFVVRLAGNVVTEDGLASLEYAVEHLHVPLIVVMGHEKCGAVSAAASADKHFSHLGRMLARIARHVHVDGKALPLDEAVAENVRASAREIETGSSVLSEALHAGRTKVVCGVAELASGKVVIFAH